MPTDLRAKVLSAVKWTAGARLLAQVFNWAITIFVVRLLSPSDYGLLAMATVVVTFLMLLAELGIGAAVVQALEIDERELGQIFGLCLAVNLLLCVLLILVAPLIASFFDESRLTSIIRALALQFPLVAMYVLPQALLERNLHFKAKSLVDLSGAVASASITLACALSGLGVWALVAGSITKVAWLAIGLNIVNPLRIRPSLNFSLIRKLASFGGYVTLTRVLWFFYSQMDILIAAKFLGKVQLGYYSVSMQLASLPVQRLSGIINEVAFPAFSRIQEDRPKVLAYLLKAVRLLALFSFPVLWGISSTAPEIVEVFLGPKWSESTLPLQILAFLMPVRMISNLMPSVIQGLGRPDISVKNLLLVCLVMPIAFLIGAPFGVVGLAAAWVVGFPPVFLWNLKRVLGILGLPLRNVLGAATPAAMAAALMYAAVLGARIACESLAASSRVQLTILMAVGAAVYSSSSLFLNRKGLHEAIALVRRP